MKNNYMTFKSNKTHFLLLQLILLFGSLSLLHAQVYVPFSQRTSSFTPTQTVYNVKGDFTMIGNTNLTLQNYGNNTNNNNNTMVYVDVDGNSPIGLGGSPTFNSSSANLTFSTENGAIPSCSKIVFAGLYWTGRASQSTAGTSNTFNVIRTINGTSYTKQFDKRRVMLRGPSASTYTMMTATNNNIYYPTNTSDYIYSGYTEITDYVRQNGLGTYTVADIALRDGNGGGTGYSGGWGIVVVYENSKMKYRDITIFDGHAYMNGLSTTNLPVSGFNTVQNGNVGVKLGLMASEGDVSLTGDFFRIQNLNTANYTNLSHSGNSASNFFNSSIATGGNTRNPNLQNNTGIDISMFNLNNTNNAIIGNSQTSTNFQYGSGGDVYAIFNITMAVDAYIPEPEGLLTVTQLNGVNVSAAPYTIQPGQDMTFTVDIRNQGTEAINNAKIVIPVPYNATYVPNTASGSVFFTPLPTPNSITFNPSLGATGSIVWDFGRLPLPTTPNQVLARLTFKLRATTDCTILNNSACGNAILVNGTLSGTGAITGVVFNNRPLIQGHTSNGTCIGEPITQSISIAINGTNYVNANCQGVPAIRNFAYCGSGNTVPVTDVASSFPVGSSFYNEFPVDSNTIQYTSTNPFPITPGSTVTYYAVPAGASGCFIPFTISRCNKIIANDDAGSSVVGAAGGVSFTNVLINDTLNGNPVTTSQVVISQISTSNAGVTLSGNNVVVAPGTPAGNYTLVYQICEVSNPTNCDTATVTVPVSAAVINAVDDSGSANGATGGTAVPNVLVNDTLNGQPVVLAQVNLTQVSTSNPNVTLDPTTGAVNVAAGTPAGNYTLVYQICEIVNPSNCDTAIVTVTVAAPIIVANDDAGTPVNGFAGGTSFTNVLVNDTLNGQPVVASQVNTTFVSSTHPGITLVGTDVVVAPGTPAGSYQLVYQICEVINPSNCDTATVFVTVHLPQIIANDDNFTILCSANGSLGNAISNDTLNGLPITSGLVNFTILSGAAPNIVIDTNGNISLTETGSCGTYTFTYQICEVLNPNNCDTATITITIQDTTNPTFVEALPADVTAECSNVPAAVTLTATDDCGEANVTFNEVTTAGACPGAYTLTRTWTATDACGNTTSHVQTVTVQDTTNPTFVETLPADVTAECSNVPAAVTLTATDNCGAANVTFNEVTTAGACPGAYTLTRTWTATDACGNTTTHVQTVTVQDTTNPTFVESLPADVTAECSNVPAAATLTATDNCGAANVTFNEATTAGACPGAYTLTRTWTATDACDNTTSHVQTVTVQDTTAPQIATAYQTVISATCDAVPAAPELQFTDNCAATVTVVFNETSTTPVNGSYTIVRTWTVSDSCNNTNTYTQTVNVTVNATTNQYAYPEAVCTDDNTLLIDIAAVIATQFPGTDTTSGTWTDMNNSGGLNTTTGVFNPYQLPDDTYVIKYTLPTATCPIEFLVSINANDEVCTVLPACQPIIVNNAVTPNGDGANDFFIIENIQDITCYPENTVEIYNRWGVKVFDTTNYDNTSRVFRGISEGRATVNQSAELPTGTYFYILKYKKADGNFVTKNGYLYLSR
ncbi:gliding motility-associated C-terminal domain-containing protein [Flavobacterium sp.]|uniref:T9SS type B sorting domain-containing protein n=1 Tax=Flavobacterium sp. TaxID=239 RepID=UPI0022C5AB44|nr:gliding motility-associated C-terminal domain-containing protein [Flavobacterium sp.]MCZ8368031.1 gliding motility-associated C-terminal domain-containing protein [Flavobacterium sp.]